MPGRPCGRRRCRGRVAVQQRGQRRGADPQVVRPKNWRRVNAISRAGRFGCILACRSRSDSGCVLDGSALGQGFVQVQDHAGHHGPGGQFGGVEPLVARSFARRASSLFGGCAVAGGRSPAAARGRASARAPRAARAAGGGQAEGPGDPLLGRRSAFGQHPFGQLPRGLDVRRVVHSTRACSGVLVRARRTTHVSRSGASKVTSDGGGAVRFQNVYIVRR